MPESNFIEYHKSIAKELNASKDRIRQLIGGRHWQTVGEHKEAVLRKVLRNHLPETMRVGKGFVCLQTRRLITGSAQVELYPGDIDKFFIPFIDTKKQEHISSLVKESYRAKREATALLEEAKKKVEEMIERGGNNQ